MRELASDWIELKMLKRFFYKIIKNSNYFTTTGSISIIYSIFIIYRNKFKVIVVRCFEPCLRRYSLKCVRGVFVAIVGFNLLNLTAGLCVSWLQSLCTWQRYDTSQTQINAPLIWTVPRLNITHDIVILSQKKWGDDNVHIFQTLLCGSLVRYIFKIQ